MEKDIIKNLNIEVKTSNKNAFLFTTILGTVLPILLIGGFMWYLIRATQKKQGDAFGFGRAGARLDQNEKNKIKSVSEIISILKGSRLIIFGLFVLVSVFEDALMLYKFHLQNQMFVTT